MSTIDTIGQRVRQLRERHEMTQEELAQRVTAAPFGAKAKQAHIGNIELGNVKPSIDVLAALAYVLETNTDYLLGLTDDDRPASDLEDQVVAAVEDAEDRALIQAMLDRLVRASRQDRRYVAELVARLLPARSVAPAASTWKAQTHVAPVTPGTQPSEYLQILLRFVERVAGPEVRQAAERELPAALSEYLRNVAGKQPLG